MKMTTKSHQKISFHSATLSMLLLSLGLSLGACASSATDVCQQVTEKRKSCLKVMDCNSYTEADDKAACEEAKLNVDAYPALTCDADAQAQSEVLMKCDLDPTKMCNTCTDATSGVDPSNPPSNGAKLFSWNSCYAGPDGTSTTSGYGSGCLEQWGSYAGSCLKLGDTKYVRGKRCKSICGTWECSNNKCYTHYRSSESWDLAASYYECL
jgi:hypothetical protein